MMPQYIVIFFISLSCILLELFYARLLYLKTFSHAAYVIVPFAILGYGIGANVYLIFTRFFDRWEPRLVMGRCLIVFPVITITSVLLLMILPVEMQSLIKFFSILSIFQFCMAFTLVIAPFVVIGFLVTYLFSRHPMASHRLYFLDLIGAGAGAFLFFPLITYLQFFRSLMLLSAVSAVTGVILIKRPGKRYLVLAAVFVAGLFFVPEPSFYIIDRSKGREWIPGSFAKNQYEVLVERWSALGRTGIYRFTDPVSRLRSYLEGPGTFEINLSPLPEFAHATLNYVAGTPIYNLSEDGLAKHGSRIELFSQGFEVPYLLSKNPRVVIIGAGGGRDIFMAKTHGAEQIVAAEINPVLYQEMSPGGRLFEYSGGIYAGPRTEVYNVDGRHLVKTLQSDCFDLLVLNGVDTFSGLSTGVYTFAESYLYTKEAIRDYLRVLKDEGMIFFVRGEFWEMPRETLRLHAIALQALKEAGLEKPWDHIIIGSHKGWAVTLIKKTPFQLGQKAAILAYFENHQTSLIYPHTNVVDPSLNRSESVFDLYAQAFKDERLDRFDDYPYDISVVTDDDPFFFQYNKFKSFNPFAFVVAYYAGTFVYYAQILILQEAVFFIALFIIVPLWVFKRAHLANLPRKTLVSFLIYFSCLGLGFMFIEIPLMQRFTLIFGSPIYSISVTLAVLLASLGVGSLVSGFAAESVLARNRIVIMAFLGLIIYGTVFELWGMPLLNQLMGISFTGRVLAVAAAIIPLGLMLGAFFPLGLICIGRKYHQAVPWAWGINCGFSVLGSILAINLAQAHGFRFVIICAGFVYLVAALAFRKLNESTEYKN